MFGGGKGKQLREMPPAELIIRSIAFGLIGSVLVAGGVIQSRQNPAWGWQIWCWGYSLFVFVGAAPVVWANIRELVRRRRNS